MQAELLVLNAQWTAVLAGIAPPELIGGQIAPWTPADFVSGMDIKVWKVDPGEYLRVQQTAVGRRGTFPVWDMKFNTTTFSLTNHGRQIITDVETEGLFSPPADGSVQFLVPPLGSLRLAKLKAMTENFWLNHELEVRDIVHGSGSYDAGLVFNVGDPIDAVNAPNGQKFVAFDDPDANPIQSIQRMIDAPLIRPNALVMGLSVWRALERNKAINQFIRGIPGIAQTQPGLITKDQLAAAFGLDKIIVGQQRANFQSAGAAAAFTRVWGRHCAAIRNEAAPLTTQAPFAGKCLTAFGKRWVKLDESTNLGTKGAVVQPTAPVLVASNYLKTGEENAGAYGAWQDLIVHTRGVVPVNTNAGTLYQNCVANDV